MRAVVTCQLNERFTHNVRTTIGPDHLTRAFAILYFAAHPPGVAGRSSATLCENVVMLIHIVCWKYKPEVDEEVRNRHRAELRALAGVITGIERFDVGADILHLDRSYETGLVAVFPDRAGLDAYTVHPEHQRVAAFGKSLAEHAVSVDFMNDE